MPAIAHQNKILGNGALVDDTTTSADKTWSSSKINTELGLKANSADVPTKAQITNPNLLDNPWFTINQRGLSSYSGSTYNVDRWRSWESGTVTVKSRGIGTTKQFAQVINDILPEINHKTVTISALLSDGTIVSTTDYLDIPTGAGTERILIATEVTNLCNVLIYGNLEYASFQVNTIGTHIGVELELLACKLELGSISTLALDSAPNIAEETLKCQRYYHIYATETLRPSNMYDCVPFMRTTPAQSTITIGGVTYYANTADL